MMLHSVITNLRRGAESDNITCITDTLYKITFMFLYGVGKKRLTAVKDQYKTTGWRQGSTI